MPNIEVPDELWNEIIAQQARFNFATQIDFLEFCLNVVQSRYWPAVSAIVTRNNAEILLVGNDYGRDELVWNLPGGAVDPGEDLIQAVSRELYEETGLTTLEIGPLAWIVQAVLADKRPFIIGFAFEVTAWQGQVSVENEVDHGDVQQAKFVPFENALECVIEGNRTALRDWLSDPSDIPKIYLSTPEGVRKIK
jgi:ADP-ribose pyrophosphatase YjhB (NUDIX family)